MEDDISFGFFMMFLLVGVPVLTIVLHEWDSIFPKKEKKASPPVRSKQSAAPIKSTSSKPSYRQTFEKFYDLGLELLQSLPGYTGDSFELLPFLSAIGGISLDACWEDSEKYSLEISQALSDYLLGMGTELFSKRFNFYIDVANGRMVRGMWSASDIPPAVLDVPMLRCAVAFGDCITNSDCISDYDNAPIAVQSFADQLEFTNIFTTKFYSLVKSYCTEIVGYDFTPPTLSRRSM